MKKQIDAATLKKFIDAEIAYHAGSRVTWDSAARSSLKYIRREIVRMQKEKP